MEKKDSKKLGNPGDLGGKAIPFVRKDQASVFSRKKHDLQRGKKRAQKKEEGGGKERAVVLQKIYIVGEEQAIGVENEERKKKKREKNLLSRGRQPQRNNPEGVRTRGFPRK